MSLLDGGKDDYRKKIRTNGLTTFCTIDRKVAVLLILVLGGLIGFYIYQALSHESNPKDAYRLDVVVPGETHFYLKASSPHERQEWLVALGTIKSCLNSEKASQLLVEGDAIKRKQCELRLYCDLLVQQVHSIKEAVMESPIPDVQKLDETTALLGDTCDTLIRTLEECVQSATSPPPLSARCVSSSPPGKKGHVRSQSLGSGNSRLSPSKTSMDFDVKESTGAADENDEDAFYDTALNANSNGHENGVNYDDADAKRLKSYFTEMQHSFATIRLSEPDGYVPTKEFLEACSELAKIFDVLGSAAFAPVKMDLNGNIRKLTQKYQVDQEKFSTLQAMVQNEIDKKTTEKANSATDALLWLKRGISFLREFIQCFENGEENLTECANKAYGLTLKRHHGWVVRGIFSIASNAMPGRDDFLTALCFEENKSDVDLSELLKQLRRDITSYVAGIDRCLRALNVFYKANHLDPDLN
uniref:Pleckstrin homology domain-containing family A member 8 n=1 Tax=Plectus sambesii TaxID=2011161 RepID=A0A914X4J5_9BILA